MVSDDNVIKEIGDWGPLFKVSLSLILHNNWPTRKKYYGILSFTGNDEIGKYARVPSLHLYGGQDGWMCVRSWIKINKRNCYFIKKADEYDLIIEQRLIDEEVGKINYSW